MLKWSDGSAPTWEPCTGVGNDLIDEYEHDKLARVKSKRSITASAEIRQRQQKKQKRREEQSNDMNDEHKNNEQESEMNANIVHENNERESEVNASTEHKNSEQEPTPRFTSRGRINRTGFTKRDWTDKERNYLEEMVTLYRTQSYRLEGKRWSYKKCCQMILQEGQKKGLFVDKNVEKLVSMDKCIRRKN